MWATRWLRIQPTSISFAWAPWAGGEGPIGGGYPDSAIASAIASALARASLDAASRPCGVNGARARRTSSTIWTAVAEAFAVTSPVGGTATMTTRRGSNGWP